MEAPLGIDRYERQGPRRLGRGPARRRELTVPDTHGAEHGACSLPPARDGSAQRQGRWAEPEEGPPAVVAHSSPRAEHGSRPA